MAEEGDVFERKVVPNNPLLLSLESDHAKVLQIKHGLENLWPCCYDSFTPNKISSTSPKG